MKQQFKSAEVFFEVFIYCIEQRSGKCGSRAACGSFQESLAHRQILADFLQNVAKQRIPPERPSKVTTDVVFS